MVAFDFPEIHSLKACNSIFRIALNCFLNPFHYSIANFVSSSQRILLIKSLFRGTKLLNTWIFWCCSLLNTSTLVMKVAVWLRYCLQAYNSSFGCCSGSSNLYVWTCILNAIALGVWNSSPVIPEYCIECIQVKVLPGNVYTRKLPHWFSSFQLSFFFFCGFWCLCIETPLDPNFVWIL